jgi:hypothetical protein
LLDKVLGKHLYSQEREKRGSMKKISQKQAVEKLDHLIARIDVLKDKSSESGEFKRWRSDVKKLLRHLFGDESTQVQDFRNLRFSQGSQTVSMRSDKERKFEHIFRDDLEDAREFLHSVAEDLVDQRQPKGD